MSSVRIFNIYDIGITEYVKFDVAKTANGTD